jgi:transmembrane sensor
MSAKKIPQEIEQQATYWYVRMQSPEFTPEQESEFFAWLESSSLHQAAFIRVDQACAAGAAAKSLPKRKTFALNWELQHWAGATAVVLIVCLLVFLSPLQQKGPAPAVENYAAAAEQQSITLSDQSSVILSPHSQMEVRYSKSARELYLHKGQIFLHVTQDAQRPLRVITDRGVVRVIGTRFAIQRLEDDLKITVVDGMVGLLKADGADSEQKPLLVLIKNQQILYSDALKGSAATTVNAERETSWAKGRMIFDGAPLTEVAAALNQHLSLPILIASPELETRRIVGAISVKDPKAAAASLASITGAVVEEAPDRNALILRATTEGF